MTSTERVVLAQDRVDQLQTGLDKVQVALAKAEDVIEATEEAKHGLRKLFIMLVVAGVIVAVVMTIKRKKSRKTKDDVEGGA